MISLLHARECAQSAQQPGVRFIPNTPCVTECAHSHTHSHSHKITQMHTLLSISCFTFMLAVDDLLSSSVHLYPISTVVTSENTAPSLPLLASGWTPPILIHAAVCSHHQRGDTHTHRENNRFMMDQRRMDRTIPGRTSQETVRAQSLLFFKRVLRFMLVLNCVVMCGERKYE